MKFIFSSALLLVLSIHAISQAINDTSYKTWTSVKDGKISNDGKFAFYRIINEPLNGSTLVVTATDKSWEFRSALYTNPTFSPDSKYLFALKGKDTLVQLKLKTKKIIERPHCNEYALLSDWLIWLSNDSLIVNNLKTGRELFFKNVLEYTLNEKGKSILITTKDNVLKWLDLQSDKTNSIYSGSNPSNFIFDQSGKSVAFITTENVIHYYHSSLSTAKVIADDSTEGILPGYRIATDDTWKFSKDGEKIFFTQTKVNEDKVIEGEPDIWNYKDAFLLSQYRGFMVGADYQNRGTNLSMLNLKSGKITQLLHGTQKVRFGSDMDNDDVLVVESSFGWQGELPWNRNAHLSYYLCFTSTGEIRTIQEDRAVPLGDMQLSPDNNFLVYYDPLLENYLSYNIKTTKTAINGSLKGKKNQIIGWLENTHCVIIQDDYDLWQIDLDHTAAPVRLINSPGILLRISPQKIIGKSKLLIGGFNTSTKQYGIYNLDITKKRLEPVFLNNDFTGNEYTSLSGLKIEKTSSYLIQLENAGKSPNYYFTKDFKTLIPISNVTPEQKYNWITAELVNYKDKQGNSYQGILYKPENFDSTKKYPLIFNYYLEESSKIHQFPDPSPARAGINVPLLVSNGYILFIPSIYRSATPGEAALHSVMAAADYLAGFSWIDTTKMGLSGHSWGGFETNYIVTHSNRFKAAISGAGISNWIEFYNDLWQQTGQSKQSYLINSMGSGLDSIPEEYVKNSPILLAKEIRTPMLLMHNNGDQTVPIDQSLQLFIQLRSLQKPVWLLQYKDEAHLIMNEINQVNFQHKCKEFFDYYLNGTSIPKWMDTPIAPK